MSGVRTTALLVLALSAVLPSTAGAEGIYAGWLRTSGEDDTLVVRTDDAGTTPRAFVVAFRADCDNGMSYAYHRTVRVGPADGSGNDVLVPTKTGLGGFAATYTGSSVTDTLTFAETGTIAGTFGKHRASGTLNMVLTATDTATGQPGVTCRTHTRHWRAVRGPQAFGGTTSQGEPVTMILRKGLRAVREFDFGWHTSCDTGDFVDVPDYVTNFPIVKHRFGGSFPYVDSAGNSAVYAFNGYRQGRRAHGTMSVSVQTVWHAQCNTGRLRWTARSG